MLDMEKRRVYKMNKSIICELKRISKGYRPVSKAWYYCMLYDICVLICIINVGMKNMLRPSYGYKCLVCGKESNDSQVIFDCIYDHEYNKEGDEKMRVRINRNGE